MYTSHGLPGGGGAWSWDKPAGRHKITTTLVTFYTFHIALSRPHSTISLSLSLSLSRARALSLSPTRTLVHSHARCLQDFVGSKSSDRDAQRKLFTDDGILGLDFGTDDTVVEFDRGSFPHHNNTKFSLVVQISVGFFFLTPLPPVRWVQMPPQTFQNFDWDSGNLILNTWFAQLRAATPHDVPRRSFLVDIPTAHLVVSVNFLIPILCPFFFFFSFLSLFFLHLQASRWTACTNRWSRYS